VTGGSRKAEVESRKSEVGSRKAEVGSRKSEVESRRSEGGSHVVAGRLVAGRSSLVARTESGAATDVASRSPGASSIGRVNPPLLLAAHGDGGVGGSGPGMAGHDPAPPGSSVHARRGGFIRPIHDQRDDVAIDRSRTSGETAGSHVVVRRLVAHRPSPVARSWTESGAATDVASRSPGASSIGRVNPPLRHAADAGGGVDGNGPGWRGHRRRA
jgi:hypothetical protein